VVAARVVRRRYAASLIARLGVMLSAGAIVGLLGVGLLRLNGHEGGTYIVLGAVASGLVLAIVMARRDRWSQARAAREIDRAQNLQDRLSSGLAMAGAAQGFARAAVDAAEAAAEVADPVGVVPIRVSWTHMVWPVVVAGALAAAVFVPPMRWDGIETTARDEVIAQATEQVQQAVAAIENIERSEATPGLDEYAAEIAAIERALSTGKGDPAGAVAQSARALESAAQRVEERTRSRADALDELRERAARAGEIKEERAASLARSIAKGDLDAAANEAARLASEARSLPNEERERIARGLESMARALDAGNEPLDPSSTSGNAGRVPDAGAPAPPTPQMTQKTAPREELPAGKPESEAQEQAPATGDSGTTPGKPAGGEAPPRGGEADKPAPQGEQSPPGEPGASETSKEQTRGMNQGQGEERAPRDASKSPSERVRDAMRDMAQELRRPATQDPPRGGTPASGEQQGQDARDKPGDPGAKPGVQPREGLQTEPRPGDGERREMPSAPGVQPSPETGAVAGEQERTPPKPTQAPGGVKPDGASPPQGERPAAAGEDPKVKEQGAGETPASERGDGGGGGETKSERQPEQGKPGETKRTQGTQGAPDSGVTNPAPGEKSAPGPDSQSPGSKSTPRESKPGASGQDGTRVERTAPGGGQGELPEGTRQGREGAQVPPDTTPTAQEGAPARSAEGVKPPVGGAKKPVGDSSGAAPTDAPAPDDPGIERLEKELRRMAEEGRSIDRRLLESEALREQARRMLERASPEQRERLEDLAQRLGGGDGSRRGGPVTPPTPRRDLETIERAPVDARGQTPEGGGPTIAQWLGDGQPGGEPRERLAQGVRRAAQGIEQSLEQQAIPTRHGEYVRRVFERYVRRTQTPGPGDAPTAPILPDAPDAPRR